MASPTPATGSTPRVLVVSTRACESAVWGCSQVEFEDVVCKVDDVDLLAPARRAPRESWALRKAQRAAARFLQLEFAFTPQLERVRVARDYELLFVYAQGVEDLAILSSVRDWRERCGKKVCFIEELWVERLRRYGDYGLSALRDFDLICVSFHESAEALRRLTGLRVEWVPGAVDAIRFYPGAVAPPRTIDVYSMGRRAEDSHRALLRHAQQRGWTYLFDTTKPAGVLDGKHEQHRLQLAAMINRSRYFIANRSRVGSEDAGQQQDLGYRSYEGAAGGAILIGDAPKCRSRELLFDWPDAHIDVPFGSPAIVDVIEELERDPDRRARIHATNVVQCLRRHDWSYRWQSMLGQLGIPGHDKLHARMRQLQTLSDTHAEARAPELGHGRRAPEARCVEPGADLAGGAISFDAATVHV